MRVVFLSGWLLSVWVGLSVGAAVAEAAPSEEQRIVAIGDIHGALQPFEAILRRAELIDEQSRWIGGTDILVQTGDFLDRGSEASGAALLLQDLQKQAKRAGGKVIVLLGNHEALNLTMDLRDVTPQIVSHFVGKRSLKRRDRYCERLYRRAIERQPEQTPADRGPFLDQCREDVPIGLLEYLDALAPDKSLGRWLRALPTVAKVGGWLFLHGGLSPDWASKPVDEINDLARQQLEQFGRLRKGLLARELIVQTSGLTEIVGVARALALVIKERDVVIRNPSLEDLMSASSFDTWTLFDPDGPLWFRGYARWSDAELAAALPSILASQEVRGVVVGHTPQRSRAIESRLDQQLFLIDTGMLNEVYGGRPSALEIIGDAVNLLYADDAESSEAEDQR